MTGAPAYAAETQTGQTDAGTQTGPVKLTFDTLEQTVRENNITIQAYEHTIQSAEETDVSDDFFNSYIELSNQISGYEQQIRALDDAIASHVFAPTYDGALRNRDEKILMTLSLRASEVVA